MGERINIADKKPKVKNQNLFPQVRRKTDHSQSMNSPVDRVMFLQRTIGNQAVGELIKSGALQAKLRIGQPGDIYEQEADRVAEQVMRMPDVSSSKDTRIQRKCPKCLNGLSGLLEKDKKDENLQAKETQSKTPEVTSKIEANVNALRGGGQPLPESTRAFFEPRFGQDFSQVRVHSDSKAAQAVNARAYTVGQDIVFGAGQYAPQTNEGKGLLAHELTHVVQQGAARPVSAVDRPLRIQPSLQPAIIQRWNLGTAPTPAGWDVITDPEHLRRYNQAEAIVRGVLTSRRCLAFFRANCTSGAANPLREAFDRANVYIRLVDDDATGAQIGDNISFNLRAFRIGRWRIANALLHETFHVCDPVFDARDEIDAETAVEQCRVFTPFISTRRPRSGPVGTQVTIEGIGFGPSQGPADQVLFNGVDAGRAISWGLVGTPGSSLARIVCEVPAGATTGDLVVVNNTVHSNALRFEVRP